MDWLRVTRSTQPSSTIVTVDEAKTHLRISHTEDDTYILNLIKAATAFIEGPTGAGIAVLSAQWRLSMDSLPTYIDIDLCPVTAIDSITVSGVALATNTYAYDLDSTPARIVGTYAPQGYIGPGKVKVTFTAGYATVPADLKQCALLLVGHLYENREGTAVVEVKEVPFAVNAILNRYRAF